MFRFLVQAWRRDLLVRLYAGVFLVVTLGSGLYTAYAMQSLRMDVEKRLKERTERLASVVSESLARPLFDFNSAAVSSAVSALGASQDVVSARVLDPEGNVMAQAGTPLPPADVVFTSRAISYVDGRQATPVGRIELALSRASVDQELQRTLRSTGISNLLMAMAMIAGIYLLGRRTARPFADIQESLSRLSRGETNISLSGIGREDQIGRLSESVQSFRDTLTRLRQAEHQTESLLREKNAMLDNALVGILTVRNRHVVSCNRRFEEMFGYGRGELIGCSTRLLYRDEAAYVKMGAGYAPLGENATFTVELPLRHKDGSSFWGALTGHPHDPAAPLSADSTWICADISERKSIEEELQQHRLQLESTVLERTRELAEAKELAELASRSKSDFLANMSHEIRTPMNAILGLAYLLENRSLRPAERDMVQKIRNAGRSLLGIINDILDFSKIEAGRMEIEHAPFRLGDVLENVATIMGTAVGDKAIELIVGPVPAGQQFLKGDALRLEQVLINLTGNAIKFTEAGEVSLTVSPANGQAGSLCFAVRDSGIGIPADMQTEIFSAFSQADNSTTRRFGGTGLGLTITRRIVGLMGGSIHIDSQPGQGSEFSFIIPLAPDEQVRPAPVRLSGLRALIADDHPVARDMLAEMTRSMGWLTSVAHSGEDAVAQGLAAMASGTPFDVLLLDWKMPGMDGLSAASRLHEALGEHPPPAIIMVTAHDREHLLHHQQAAVADAILTKPVTASAIYNAVGAARSKGDNRQFEAPRAGGRLKGIRILVVDDSEINCEVARHILEEEGAQVVLAADGLQAVDTLRTRQVDLVLMDVQMPVMDGIEATRQIRENLGLQDLPVLALTAGAFKNQQEAALKAGMNGFVPKPFEVDELILAVLGLTGRPVAVSRAAESTPEARPIDVARGLRNWGSQDVFRKYLFRFAEEHGQDGLEIAALLARGVDATALVHKLKGAAGSMALQDVWRQADRLEQALDEAKDQGKEPAEALARLQAALEAAGIAIEAWTEPADALGGNAAPDAATGPLLAELLQALDRDNPDEAEPILAALAGKLPAKPLAALHEHLEAFDFRSAEAIARGLMQGPTSEEMRP